MAKRTPRAAFKIAVDLVNEGLIDVAEALRRVADLDLAAARVSRFSEAAEPLALATVASPGVACGRACFTSGRASEVVARGDPAILIRPDTSTEDVAGFAAADGVLTAIGGRTAHAAVVARQMGKVCLVGCRSLVIDQEGGAAVLGGRPIREGDWVALDGATGEISLGRRATILEDSPEAATCADGASQRGDCRLARFEAEFDDGGRGPRDLRRRRDDRRIPDPAQTGGGLAGARHDEGDGRPERRAWRFALGRRLARPRRGRPARHSVVRLCALGAC